MHFARPVRELHLGAIHSASKLPSCEIHLRIPRTFWLWSIVGTGAEYLSENNCRFVGFCWDGIGAFTIAHGFHAFRNLLAQCVAVRYESFGILNQAVDSFTSRRDSETNPLERFFRIFHGLSGCAENRRRWRKNAKLLTIIALNSFHPRKQ